MTLHRLPVRLRTVEPPADTELDGLNGMGWIMRAERISAAKARNRAVAKQQGVPCHACGGEGIKITFDPREYLEPPKKCPVCWGDGYLT